MTTIKFERIERDCDHNKSIRRDGETRGLLYDFKVIIYGEHRATLSRCGHRPGYYVQDADGNMIVGTGTVRGLRQAEMADKQANFEPVIQRLLSGGYIPTLEQMAAVRADKEAKRLAREAEERERVRVYRIQSAGEDLLAALKELRAATRDCAAAMGPARTPCIARLEAAERAADAAIAEAEGK